MTFEELVEEVFILTNRRDLVAETESSVKAATLRMHKLDFFSRDIYETGIEFDSPQYRQSLDYITLVSNFRAIKYVRIVQDQNDEDGKLLEIITPDEVLDSYGQNRNDIAYIAGRVLEIRSSTTFTKALFGCYVSPIVRIGAYESWVAELNPFAIVYDAARVVYRAIGQMEESNAMASLLAEEAQMLKMEALATIGE